MNTRIKRILLVVLTIGIIISIGGCASLPRKADGGDPNGIPDCIVNGKEIYFIDDEAKIEWTEPLAKLLANVLVAYGEHGEIMGYEAAVDSDAPAIPEFYECGLMDFTGDGIPELLVNPIGYFGSSGVITYFAYDIYSGERIGFIDGGFNQSWCLYYYLEDDSIATIGQYWLRGGWSWRGKYLTKISFNTDVMEYCEEIMLRSAHDVDAVQVEDIYDEEIGEYIEAWEEIYPDTKYFCGIDEVSIDTYFAEYDHFARNYFRIPETEIVFFCWEDVSSKNDGYIVRGEKMAKALVTSEQEFIIISTK